ncbi:putative cytochrome p450 protein [Botrytis cinerea BcDW1]|uniref:Putative cytochrome p450 protein n=1 Tax=Botryotinia fuckeliana (strain BcDW1) TaxID=1290391 RepID=M7TVP2_BOTF1|nr:putative cytochrome p450 protein [Botrytis cinerea BcDW1]
MVKKSFFLLGQPPRTSQTLEVDLQNTFEYLQYTVAQKFSIAEPSGISFQTDEDGVLDDLDNFVDVSSPIGILIDGNQVRDVPGPTGLPIAGSYYEVYPDHLGNHQRLFEQYGPVFKTTDMGRTAYYTNDPKVADICFGEGGYWSKVINSDHPLYGIKDPMAGVFLSDTDTESWRETHKFLAPALSPKAVRHYTPQMQDTAEQAFKVFDELDKKDEAWNVYHYMFKMGSTAIGKLALGMDMHHFDSIDAPLHDLVRTVGRNLELNKKVSTMGDWYSHMPWGAPKQLKDNRAHVQELIEEAIRNVKGGGTENLPMKDAALKATCIVDYLVRATDEKGHKLAEKYRNNAALVTVGAGFITTASLLSWLLYSIASYPGNQERLLQELVDHDVTNDTEWTTDLANSLEFLGILIKETQRLHNPSYQPGRTALADVIIPGGYRIPKGSIMIIAIHHIHNNPKVWDSPADFDPDRWNTEKVKNRHKTSYVPFAAGPRMCIGFNFALQEVRVILSMLVYRYEFEKTGNEPVEYDPEFQLVRPNNFYVKARRRTRWPEKSKKPTSTE